jgi:hypothetical protein
MKLTKKKKMLIASAAIRDIQILSLSILQYKSIASDLIRNSMKSIQGINKLINTCKMQMD